MQSFRKYYENRIEENFVTDLADLFLSKYAPRDYTGWNPTKRAISQTPYRPGLLTNPEGGLNSQDAPVDDNDVQNWDVRYANTLDDPDVELKRIVYEKIKDMIHDPAAGIHNPKDVMTRLMQDPEVQHYLGRVNKSQMGAFTRSANKEFGNVPSKPLGIYRGQQSQQPSSQSVSGIG